MKLCNDMYLSSTPHGTCVQYPSTPFSTTECIYKLVRIQILTENVANFFVYVAYLVH